MSLRTICIIGVVFALAMLAAVPVCASGVRIVRLSYASGDVRLARSAGATPEAAILNTPIIEGARLITGEDGRAEIEFENGSVVRIAGPAEITFDKLGVTADHGHVNNLGVVRGTMYVRVRPQKHDEYSFNLGSSQMVALDHSAHLRIQVDLTNATVAVMDGEAQLRSGESAQSIQRGQSVTLALTGDSKPVARGIDPISSDAWDTQRDRTHEAAFAHAKENPSAFAFNGYGATDLNNFGEYTFMPGFGYMWQPFGVGPGWDPFSYGAWGMYPGFGWTFISAYPWGWAPYRYGSWYWITGNGWMWAPGNYSAANWNPVPAISSRPSGFAGLLAPTTTVTSTQLVGKPPLAVRGGGPIAVMPRTGTVVGFSPRAARTGSSGLPANTGARGGTHTTGRGESQTGHISPPISSPRMDTPRTTGGSSGATGTRR